MVRFRGFPARGTFIKRGERGRCAECPGNTLTPAEVAGQNLAKGVGEWAEFKTARCGAAGGF